MAINHLLTGMVLQVVTGPCQKEGFGCVFRRGLLDLQKTTSDLRSRLILRVHVCIYIYYIYHFIGVKSSEKTNNVATIKDLESDKGP